jgi:putative membrane protein
MRGEKAGTLSNDSSAMANGSGMQGNGAAALTDAQITHVAMTTNRMDSTTAASVVARLRNAGAKNFAHRMIKEHGATMDSIRALSTRLGSTPATNPISTSLEQLPSPTMDSTGAALDRMYMDHEVAMHEQVLRTIDESLLPQARDASVKQLVERMRASVADHLASAQSIRAKLSTK